MLYCASKTKHADKWIQLREKGVGISSTWIDLADVDREGIDLRALWVRCVREVESSTCLLAYREPDEVLKGALVEIGCALAAGIPVVAIGLDPAWTVLRHPLVSSFETLADALKALEDSRLISLGDKA